MLNCEVEACPTGTLSATSVISTEGDSYIEVSRYASTSCGDNIGTYITTWTTAEDCWNLAQGQDWMPYAAGECATVNCDQSPCTWDPVAMEADVVAIFQWSNQCRLVCSGPSHPDRCSATETDDTHTLLYYRCGDGKVLNGMEECDDGNNEDGDGCSRWCTIEPTSSN